jgi:hypothetical protein
MDDILKLRVLIENGYFVKDVNVDGSGKGIITCIFSGMGKSVEGQVYYLITDDAAVIEIAKKWLINPH